VSIKNDGHYFCRAGGNRPDGLNEPVTNRLALMPFSRASFEMDIPGSQEAATSSCLNSGG
ncbi:hypothetical protein, partial [Escherichia coli]|uniref:hypothetical protein n=1 Tax=Escherichia coli TaxID=562 RepID=UPI001BC89F03